MKKYLFNKQVEFFGRVYVSGGTYNLAPNAVSAIKARYGVGAVSEAGLTEKVDPAEDNEFSIPLVAEAKNALDVGDEGLIGEVGAKIAAHVNHDRYKKIGKGKKLLARYVKESHEAFNVDGE